MILIVDNYDSFVHNLARYFERLGQKTFVARNDAVDKAWMDTNQPRALVISPGPCGPSEAGNTLALLDEAIGNIPVLGVCLGHQAIIESLGGKIVKSGRPTHGRSSEIQHDEQQEFEGLPNPLTVARYHSLIAEPSTVPNCLQVSARTSDETIMAVRHRELPVFGWQFHPESILTEHGYALLSAFLRLAEFPVAALPDFDSELPRDDVRDERWPSGVSF